MTKEKSNMDLEINEMSNRIKNSAIEYKKALDDNQEVIRSYKEKRDKQNIEIDEFKSQIARLKVDLEDETKVSCYIKFL